MGQQTNLAGLRYLLHVSSAVGLSFRSQYLEFFRVILYSWLCLSKLATPSMQKFLIIGLLDLYPALSRFSSSWVFWFIPGELICMWHISNSTAEGQHHAMQGCVLYYGFQHYEISMNFITFGSQSDWSIINYLTKSAHFILFRMG